VSRKFRVVHPPQLWLAMVIPTFSILSPCVINWGKAEKFLNYFKMVNTSVLCCEISMCGCEPKIQRCSPSKAENFFKLLPDGEHLCSLLCGVV